MNEFIFEGVLNGDLATIIEGIDYSTSPREIVTVGKMEKHHRIQTQKFYDKLEKNVIYGLKVKGMMINV